MPESLPPHPPRSLSLKKPEWALVVSESQRRAGANRRARQQSRREQARQRAVVATYLRDLAGKA